MNYVPIGFKSDYSLLKTLLKIKDIIKYAKDNDATYVGLLDDNPYGIMDFYDKCCKNDLKCIFGMNIKIGEYKIYLYIENYTGYQNLIQINELIINNELTIDKIFKLNSGLQCVLPYESYNLHNRFKNVFETFLAYKNEYELNNAILITKKVLFLNEIQMFKKEDTNLLKIIYKIDASNYEDNSNYILNATEFDKNNIKEFIQKIDLKFEFNNRYIPLFCKTKEESKSYLYTLTHKGLEKRLNGQINDVYQKRLDYELSVIEKMGYIDYFLIVYDYVKFAKKNNIMVGPGRGSAAGSLVSYSLGITDVDPIEYNLLFERFLNPERVTMPDIDMDFEDSRRGEVIDYVRNRYGEKNVALIVAYGTLGSKQSLRDSGKILEIDNKLIDGLCKLVDAKLTLKDNIKNEKVLEFIKTNNLQKYYKVANRLEGLKRHTTIHAAGVVISSEKLTNLVPTYKTSDGILTGYTMEYLEELGLLKMDFLALRNLTVIHNIVNLIQKQNPKFSLKNIPLDDVKTYQIFQNANTDNIFQFESPGMKNFLRKLNPTCFADLVAANAMFRPGPMQNIDEFVARKKGLKPVTYLHPDLEPILNSTYGIIIYQEQIMQILSKMGGYTFAEADLIRRAMSKKKKEVMEKEKFVFIQKSKTLGYDTSISEQVYDLIVKFADYGFNKSHSVAYAQIGYQMAYLKANYMELFHVNTLNMNIGSDAKTKDVIDDAKKKGLKIVRPNINKSKQEYVVENGNIILPLTSIKNISSQSSTVIIDNAPYKDYFDFLKKVYGNSVNKVVVETLIKAGALDCFDYSKNTLLKNIDPAITYVELCKSLDESLIMKPAMEIDSTPDTEYSEIDMFGFYISGHPVLKIEKTGITKIADFKKFVNRNTNTLVLVEKFKVINTKKGEKMAFVDISDETGAASSVIFPKLNILIDLLENDSIFEMNVRIGDRNGELQVIVNTLKKYENENVL